MRHRLSSVFTRVRDRALYSALGLPGAPRPYVREDDLRTPMPDGVVLLADRYRPRDATGPQPVVVVRSPYGRRGLLSQVLVLPLALRGFQVLVQSTRGTFGSGGEFRPFCHERDDGLATLAWVREQPWCDGRVATYGPSYLGHTQWAVLPYADPPVDAACVDITAARMTSAFYTDGVPNLRNALGWAQQIGRQELTRLPPLIPNLRDAITLRRALACRPLQAADVAATGTQVLFWRDFAEHARPGDPHWVQADHADADLTAMPPTSMVTGWWDLFAAEQLDDVARLQAAGKPVQVTVGPWMHGEPAQLTEIAGAAVRWLERHLNGVDLDPDRAPVRLYLQGADQWLDLRHWPPTQSHPTPVHLQPDARLGAAAPTVEAGSTAGSTAFTFDPADPTPSVGGPLLTRPGKQADNRAVEARDDVLTFTGPPLTEPLDLVGEVSATVFVRADQPHADLFVRLCEVDEAGVSRNVVDGVRAFSPDGDTEVTVRLFPTAYRIPTGHRLRVQVAAGGFPRFRANPGTGEPFAAATDGVPVRVEVLHDAAHPSRLTLPVFNA